MTILCTIDLETREVSIPSGQCIAAYDHNVDVIRFQAEAIPGFSLDTSSIKIAAQGPNKARHDYAVDPSTVQIEEETGYITFDWPIPAGVTEMPIGTFKYGDRGQLIFAVCAEIISGDTVSKAWHSDDGIITVVAHLEPESGGGEDPEEEATNAQKIGQLQTDVAVVQREVAAVAGGTPTVVDAKADMTEHDKIYILSSDSKWYYYSSTASDWLAGGTYGGVPTDTTLSISGSAADAKAVGDAVDALDDRVAALENGSSGGLTADIKAALLACFANVAWAGNDGQDFYDALESALNPPVNLSSITCVYTQSGTVYDTSSLDDLKADLVVTAHWSDNTTSTITNYVLSGTLAEGTSTITVSYGGKTTSFTVTVASHLILTHNWDFKTSLTDTVGAVTAVCNNCSQVSGTGVAFDASTDNIVLGDVFGFDKTLEIDYEDATATFGNVNGIIFWTNQAISSGFGYHHDSVSSKRRFGYFSSDVAHWAIASDYQKSSFDGSGTIKMTIDSQGIVTVYKDDVDINLLYNSAPPYYSTESNASYITLGSPSSSYPCFVGMTITGVRIYEGV